MQYYNVHAHTFTMNNAPAKFLELYLPKFIAGPVDGITDTKVGSAVIRGLMSLAGNGGRRYADFLKVGKSSGQAFVFKTMLDAFADDPTMCFISLTMNMESVGAGPSASGFQGQLDEILNLKKEYPDRLLIFFGLDPRWKGTGSEIRRAVERAFNARLQGNELRQINPFVGLKLYPSTGFYVFDAKLKETFEWAADNGVPVMSHCSYLGGIYNNDKSALQNSLNPIDPYTGRRYAVPQYIEGRRGFKKLLRRMVNTNNSYDNLRTCSYFLEPSSYDTIFEYFETKYKNPLKMCLAHFGGDDQAEIGGNVRTSSDEEENNPYGVARRNWFLEVRRLLSTYKKSAYTDISYGVYKNDLFNVFAREANNPDYGNKIMFGTDFFMTERTKAQNKLYSDFKSFAIREQLTSGNTMWDSLASTNITAFLKSNYW